jgi:Mg2+-importing ATPase
LSGFAAFLDPVKENARQAIDQLEHIGIEVKVITGDNELVTQKACDEAGIVVKGVLLGSEIVEMSDHALEIAAMKTTIFARFSPAEKERVIKALKRAEMLLVIWDG